MPRTHTTSLAGDTQERRRLLYSTQDACFLLGGIHPRTLRRLVLRGRITPVKLLGINLYRHQDLLRLIEQGM